MRERRWTAVGDDEQRWLLKALREVANEMVECIYDLAMTDPDLRLPNDDRTPYEVAAHILAYEEQAAAQIRHLIGSRREPLPVSDTEAAPQYADGSIYNLLEGFIEARRRTSRLLWELTPAQWRKEGRHPYRGRITLKQIVRELAEHDLEYLWQVRRARNTLPDDNIP